MSEGKRRRPKRRKMGDTTKDHAATQHSQLPMDHPEGRRRRLWRPCGDDWPTERIQAALNCWDMLPPHPTLPSLSGSDFPSFPAIVCQPRRCDYSQSSREGSSDTSRFRQAVLADKLPTIPAPTTTMSSTSKDDSNKYFATNSIVDKIQQRHRHPKKFDLTGATVRINRGQYVNCTGIITETMDVHLLQLDTVPTPLAIQDVYVLRYSDSYKGDGFDKYTGGAGGKESHENENDHTWMEYIRNKYTGATVYVAPNSSANCVYWGVQGTVLRVLDLGYWYVIDNPNVEMAFRASNFDVVRYADKWGDNGDNNHNDAEIIEINDDDDDDYNTNGDACIQKVCYDEIRSGQPSALCEEESSNIRHSFPIEREVSNKSPGEAEQETFRSEDEACIDASDKTKTLCSEDISTSMSPCDGKNHDSIVENDSIVNKERMGIDLQATPLKAMPSAKIHDDSVVHKDGKGDNNHSLQAVENAVEIEKGQILTKQQTVSCSKDKVGKSVELNSGISSNDPKEETGGEEGKESDPPCASERIASENSDYSVVTTTEATRQPHTTIDNKNAASYTSTNIDETPTTRRSPSEIKRKITEVYSVELPSIESIELAARLSAFDSFLFLTHGRQHTWNNARDATKKDASDDAAAVMSDQGRGEVEDVLMARTNRTENLREHSTISPLPAFNNEQIEIDQAEANSTGRNNDFDHANDIAWRNVVSNLHKQHCESRNWPTVMALPGTEVLMDKKLQSQEPLRIVPLEERIVRIVPGSLAECAELSERLSVFDDYMFLLGK